MLQVVTVPAFLVLGTALLVWGQCELSGTDAEQTLEIVHHTFASRTVWLAVAITGGAFATIGPYIVHELTKARTARYARSAKNARVVAMEATSGFAFALRVLADASEEPVDSEDALDELKGVGDFLILNLRNLVETASRSDARVLLVGHDDPRPRVRVLGDSECRFDHDEASQDEDLSIMLEDVDDDRVTIRYIGDERVILAKIQSENHSYGVLRIQSKSDNLPSLDLQKLLVSYCHLFALVLKEVTTRASDAADEEGPGDPHAA